MPWRRGDEMGIVAKLLFFTAAVLVILGAWMVLATRQQLLGVLVIAAGLIDALMAWGLTRRG